jgi:hypothetical protein
MHLMADGLVVLIVLIGEKKQMSDANHLHIIMINNKKGYKVPMDPAETLDSSFSVGHSRCLHCSIWSRGTHVLDAGEGDDRAGHARPAVTAHVSVGEALFKVMFFFQKILTEVKDWMSVLNSRRCSYKRRKFPFLFALFAEKNTRRLLLPRNRDRRKRMAENKPRAVHVRHPGMRVRHPRLPRPRDGGSTSASASALACKRLSGICHGHDRIGPLESTAHTCTHVSARSFRLGDTDHVPTSRPSLSTSPRRTRSLIS